VFVIESQMVIMLITLQAAEKILFEKQAVRLYKFISMWILGGIALSVTGYTTIIEVFYVYVGAFSLLGYSYSYQISRIVLSSKKSELQTAKM
jgi:hypothetical protein